MNCLVTKLQVNVNNPNLPILKTDIDNFTKAAILASNNGSMTIEQKWALDSYFATLGAFDNTGIWQKIKALYLPVILLDGENSKIYVNYKNVAATAGTDAQSRQRVLNGGAYSAVLVAPTEAASTAIDMNFADCSFYFSEPTGIISTNQFKNIAEIFTCKNGDAQTVVKLSVSYNSNNLNFNIVGINSSSAVCGFRKTNVAEGSIDIGSEVLLTHAGTTNPTMNLYLRDSDNDEKGSGFTSFATSSNQGADEVVSTTVKVVLNTYNYYNIMMVGSALTKDEAETFIQAGIDLKKAFIANS